MIPLVEGQVSHLKLKSVIDDSPSSNNRCIDRPPRSIIVA